MRHGRITRWRLFCSSLLWRGKTLLHRNTIEKSWDYVLVYYFIAIHKIEDILEIGVKGKEKNSISIFLQTIVFLWSGMFLRVPVWGRFLPHEVCPAESVILRHLRFFEQRKWLGVTAVCTMCRWLAWLKSANHNDYRARKKNLGNFFFFFFFFLWALLEIYKETISVW